MIKPLLLLVLAVSILQSTPVAYGVFAVPGASDTAPAGVNDSGVIAGSYVNSTGEHGFIRSADGSTYTTIDVPGATATIVFGINNLGDVVGDYSLAGSSQIHEFIRTANGAYGTFDIPGIQSGFALGPVNGINSSDQVVGSTNGSGFIRSSAGVITSFDVPGQQGNCCFEQLGINDAGVVVGTTDNAGTLSDFIRGADGSYVVFDPPGFGGSNLLGINNQGEVVGFSFGESVSFVRSADGTSYTILPAVPLFPSFIVEAHGINDSGEIVGTFGEFGGGYSFCTGPCAGSTILTPEVETTSMTLGGLLILFLLPAAKKNGHG